MGRKLETPEQLRREVREIHQVLAEAGWETDQERADQLWADYGFLARLVCEEKWDVLRFILKKDWDR